MSVNTFDIQEGMEVFSSDGEKIGKVNEVHAESGVATESGAQATSTAAESESNDGGSGGFGAADNLTLGRVFTDDSAGSNHDATRDPTEMREEYGATATVTPVQGGTGYFTLSEGGILGLGAKDLFIPFTAVETVAADGVVTLSCTKDDAGNRFNHEPDGVNDSNAPDMPIV